VIQILSGFFLTRIKFRHKSVGWHTNAVLTFRKETYEGVLLRSFFRKINKNILLPSCIGPQNIYTVFVLKAMVYRCVFRKTTSNNLHQAKDNGGLKVKTNRTYERKPLRTSSVLTVNLWFLNFVLCLEMVLK
jgi:hypothetical protein